MYTVYQQHQLRRENSEETICLKYHCTRWPKNVSLTDVSRASSNTVSVDGELPPRYADIYIKG